MSLTQSPPVPAIAHLPEEFSLLEISGSYQRPWRKEVASSKLKSEALEDLAVGVALMCADFARIALPLCREIHKTNEKPPSCRCSTMDPHNSTRTVFKNADKSPRKSETQLSGSFLTVQCQASSRNSVHTCHVDRCIDGMFQQSCGQVHSSGLIYAY